MQQVFRLRVWVGLWIAMIGGMHGAMAEASYDRAADQHGFEVFMREGGWCWFQDPRAIVHDDVLLVGSVRGNGDGEALVGVYDLDKKKSLGSVTMHPQFDRDDHNSPVFHVRPDNSVLAVYARHNRDSFHHSRVSDPKDFTKWSEESKFKRSSPHGRDRVTYMNLFELSAENQLYLFYRGIEFNPTYVTSRDHGKSWSEPVHFIKNDIAGRHRPYARYASNGKDTIHVSVTNGHPRNYGNSIYYAAFRDGAFYRADGKKIRDLEQGGALSVDAAEMVYEGSMTTKKPKGFESVPGAAWTSDMAVDAAGHPHIAYSLYLSNDDHRYRLASWNGKEWIDREIAYAGKCLYPRESSYTGLVSLDPEDPSVVVISTDVAPSTGEDRGGKHEIYRATIGPDDDIKSIQWKAVTKDSPVRNIRPMIVRDGTRRVVLWNRGDFRTYRDYQLDTIGFVEKAVE